MQNKYKILFIGDIVGRPGREIVKKFLVDSNKKSEYDFVIANIENASHGFGLTKKNHDELLSYGIDCMTSGNHIWDKKDILSYIDESEVLIRPNNYHKSLQGVGYRIFNDKIIVLNFLGKTFMPPIECPFVSLDETINKIKETQNLDDKIILIDFHAEASAEKQCFAKYALDNYNISALIGTHTHVQTADERILQKKCAYITDVGFCGSKNSIIGMEYDASLKRLITSLNERFDVETKKPYVLNACEIIFDGNVPKEINRINFEYNELEDVADEKN